MKANTSGNFAQSYYNFVMASGDRLYVVTNARNIPESVCRASALEAYANEGLGTLG